MYRRINITLPDKTLKLLDQLVPKGNRSQVINEAICYYLNQTQKAQLREQLKVGAICRAERDQQLAEAWYSLEEEICSPEG